MGNLSSALQQLRAERKQAQTRVESIDQAISVIESLNGSGTFERAIQPTRIISKASRLKMAQAQRARWAKAKKESQPAVTITKTTGSAPVKHSMSAAARKKIAAFQRARWAKAREQSQPIAVAKITGAAPVKRTMSAAARKKIAAFQKARWAKLKAGKKAA